MRVADLFRRLPELAALDERLADPEWHPTAEEVAEATAALAQGRAGRQAEMPLRAPQ